MTEEELVIWRAAYATAFANEHARLRNSPFYDRAEKISAETAINVADQAVHRLRQWRAAENPEAGKTISEYWKDK